MLKCLYASLFKMFARIAWQAKRQDAFDPISPKNINHFKCFKYSKYFKSFDYPIYIFPYLCTK